MSDNLTPTQRRRCMKRNKGRDTKPELALRRLLWSRGCRYRIKSSLPGHPDFVFLTAKVAVFVDGCYWHGCEQHFSLPETNRDFWEKKITRNRARDEEVTERLKSEGWTVLRFWEHELRQDIEGCAQRVLTKLQGR